MLPCGLRGQYLWGHFEQASSPPELVVGWDPLFPSMADLAAKEKKTTNIIHLASSPTIPNPQNHQSKPPHAMRLPA